MSATQLAAILQRWDAEPRERRRNIMCEFLVGVAASSGQSSRQQVDQEATLRARQQQLLKTQKYPRTQEQSKRKARLTPNVAARMVATSAAVSTAGGLSSVPRVSWAVDADAQPLASLFLSRVVTSIRVALIHHAQLGVSLMGIRAFLRSSNGLHFVDEFVEMGGVELLGSILDLRTGWYDSDVLLALLVLRDVASHGRTYKELLVKQYNVVHYISGTICMRVDKRVQKACAMLMTDLALGSPACMPVVVDGIIILLHYPALTAQTSGLHIIATLISSLITPARREDGTVASELLAWSQRLLFHVFRLVASPIVGVQYEAADVLIQLCQHEQNNAVVVDMILALLCGKEICPVTSEEFITTLGRTTTTMATTATSATTPEAGTGTGSSVTATEESAASPVAHEEEQQNERGGREPLSPKTVLETHEDDDTDEAASEAAVEEQREDDALEHEIGGTGIVPEKHEPKEEEPAEEQTSVADDAEPLPTAEDSTEDSAEPEPAAAPSSVSPPTDDANGTANGNSHDNETGSDAGEPDGAEATGGDSHAFSLAMQDSLRVRTGNSTDYELFVSSSLYSTVSTIAELTELDEDDMQNHETMRKRLSTLPVIADKQHGDAVADHPVLVGCWMLSQLLDSFNADGWSRYAEHDALHLIANADIPLIVVWRLLHHCDLDDEDDARGRATPSERRGADSLHGPQQQGNSSALRTSGLSLALAKVLCAMFTVSMTFVVQDLEDDAAAAHIGEGSPPTIGHGASSQHSSTPVTENSDRESAQRSVTLTPTPVNATMDGQPPRQGTLAISAFVEHLTRNCAHVRRAIPPEVPASGRQLLHMLRRDLDTVRHMQEALRAWLFGDGLRSGNRTGPETEPSPVELGMILQGAEKRIAEFAARCGVPTGADDAAGAGSIFLTQSNEQHIHLVASPVAHYTAAKSLSHDGEAGPRRALHGRQLTAADPPTIVPSSEQRRLGLEGVDVADEQRSDSSPADASPLEVLHLPDSASGSAHGRGLVEFVGQGANDSDMHYSQHHFDGEDMQSQQHSLVRNLLQQSLDDRSDDFSPAGSVSTRPQNLAADHSWQGSTGSWLDVDRGQQRLQQQNRRPQAGYSDASRSRRRPRGVVRYGAPKSASFSQPQGNKHSTGSGIPTVKRGRPFRLAVPVAGGQEKPRWSFGLQDSFGDNGFGNNGFATALASAATAVSAETGIDDPGQRPVRPDKRAEQLRQQQAAAADVATETPIQASEVLHAYPPSHSQQLQRPRPPGSQQPSVSGGARAMRSVVPAPQQGSSPVRIPTATEQQQQQQQRRQQQHRQQPVPAPSMGILGQDVTQSMTVAEGYAVVR